MPGSFPEELESPCRGLLPVREEWIWESVEGTTRGPPTLFPVKISLPVFCRMVSYGREDDDVAEDVLVLVESDDKGL